MIRSILCVLWMVIFFLVSLPLFAIEWIVGKISPRAKDISQMRIMQWGMRVLTFLAGTKVTVRGRDLIPTDKPVLYAINHRSMFDVVTTYPLFPAPTGYISKIEIQKVPVLNMWIKRMHGFFLDREDIRAGLKTILAAIDEVKAGFSIAIFPEGTRSREEDITSMLPFHDASFKIAQKTGCPIVPVTIANTSAILEDHFPVVKSQHIIIEFGEPIDPAALTGEDKKHMGKYVQNIMQETLVRNCAELTRK